MKYGKTAKGLESVSPKAPMTSAALILGLANESGRTATTQEISEAPAIPEGASREEYAALLRRS